MKVLKKALLNLFKKPITSQYPKIPSKTPKGFRGKHKIYFEKCTGCGLCGMLCPSNAIKLGKKIKKIKVKKLEHRVIIHPILSIDLSKCIFCGLCQDVCPVNAIKLTRKFDLADYHKTLIQK